MSILFYENLNKLNQNLFNSNQLKEEDINIDFRRMKLKHEYDFFCECTLCVDNLPIFKFEPELPRSLDCNRTLQELKKDFELINNIESPIETVALASFNSLNTLKFIAYLASYPHA